MCHKKKLGWHEKLIPARKWVPLSSPEEKDNGTSDHSLLLVDQLTIGTGSDNPRT